MAWPRGDTGGAFPFTTLAMPLDPTHIRRPALVARILAAREPFVVIEASAGMGKSWLMAELAEQSGHSVATGPRAPVSGLWDIAPGVVPTPLPDAPPRGALPPLVICKRPETPLPGLARAAVYGRLARVPLADLFLTEDDLAQAGHPEPQRALSLSGGWPCLLRFATDTTPPADMIAFLRDEVLADLPPAALVAFQTLLERPRLRLSRKLLRLIPFATPEQPLHPAIEVVRHPLSKALAERIAEAATSPVPARAIGTAMAAMDRVPEAIATLQSIGAWRAAIETLRADGGPFFIHRHGFEAFDQMLAGFPPDLLREDDTLVTCRAIQAVKRGGIETCMRILSDRWPGAADAFALLADRRVSFEARFFRFLVMTWQDFDLTPAILEAGWQLLAEIPADNDLLRGSFSNAVLEFYIRARRFPEAELEAARAAGHYARAGIPILSFYIDLHRAIIGLFQGEVRAARRHVTSARTHLRACTHDSPGDARLLALIDACIDYERGRTDPLSQFLALETDALAQGEIWPTMVELVLIYGSQALGESRSTLAARALLDRWRVVGARSDQFRTLIAIREVGVIQNGNRWAEAERALRQIAIPVTPDALLRQGAALVGALTDRDQLAFALIWLRQMAWLEPGREGLEPILAAAADNPALTPRQRMCVDIWRAHVLRRTRRQTEAQSLLLKVLARAEAAGTLAVLGEERAFLRDLTATRAVRAAVERSGTAQKALRAAQTAGPGRFRRAAARGLTRQETRILHILAEGAGNKAMANTLGLSESTVKFHLANLYRKLDARDRKSALATAQALRLLD